MRKRSLRILGVALAAALIIGLLPVIPAFALAGTLNAPSPASAPPGTGVVITGTGYTPNTTFYLWMGSNQIGSGTAVGGNVSTTFTVPNFLPRGTYSLTITTTASDTSNTQSFTIVPGLVLSSLSGGVGDQISITGYGFSASNTITIVFDGTTQLTTTSSTAGSYSVTLTIPKTTRGTHTITAYDNVYGASASQTFTVLAKLTVSPTATTIGAPVSLVGSGFAASSTVNIYLDSTSITNTVTDSTGGFTLSNFTLPATTAGAHTIRAQDGGGNYQTVAISVISGIVLDPASGIVGSQATVTGSGFRANDTITLTLDNTLLNTGSVNTDSQGRFSTIITIPPTAGGAHQLKAADSVGSDTETFTVTADASMTPTSGYVGTQLTVSGTGFLASQGITLIFDNTPVGTTAASAQGSFSFQFKVPARQAGTYKVRVTDGQNIKDINFVVTTSATITPTSASAPGFVGQTVTVSGVGFNSGAKLTITYDGKQVTTGTVGADSNFSINFKAPASAGGEHTIIITDGTITLPLVYYMDSTAPAAPILLTPETGERQKAQGTFTWNAVSDPSGVTYDLEIASSASFASGTILVQKTGLTATEYTLLKEEALKSTKKDAPDFWRVRAVDNASNDGNWSNVWSFTVGSVLPAWALWTLIGLGALIIVLFAFWLGRRSGPKTASTRIHDSQ